MITIFLQGGLGNQLFQLAFLDYVSKLNNTQSYLDSIQNSPHSNIHYFDTIFQNWKGLIKPIITHRTIIEPQNSWVISLKKQWGVKELNVKIYGFFQHYKYILPNFISKLTFPNAAQLLIRYPTIQECVFLHIRGGDYLTTFHSKTYGFDTDKYYPKAISMFPIDTKFVIFTNDKEYAESKEFLKNINYEYIEENEVDSLFLMSKCAGGICANSTFSWWGAYLNKNRKLILPSNWIIDNTRNTEGYYFKECISI